MAKTGLYLDQLAGRKKYVTDPNCFAKYGITIANWGLRAIFCKNGEVLMLRLELHEDFFKNYHFLTK